MRGCCMQFLLIHRFFTANFAALSLLFGIWFYCGRFVGAENCCWPRIYRKSPACSLFPSAHDQRDKNFILTGVGGILADRQYAGDLCAEDFWFMCNSACNLWRYALAGKIASFAFNVTPKEGRRGVLLCSSICECACVCAANSLFQRLLSASAYTVSYS